MVSYLKTYLSDFDSKIAEIPVIHGPNRAGDIPHSLASIEKAKKLLNWNPGINSKKDFEREEHIITMLDNLFTIEII